MKNKSNQIHPEMKFHYHKQYNRWLQFCQAHNDFWQNKQSISKKQLRQPPKPFFEGWYYKCASAQIGNIAIIFGLCASKQEQQAFIQIVHHSNIQGYYTFPFTSWTIQDDPFLIQIGNNTFTQTTAIVQMDHFQLKMEMDGIQPLPTSFWHPSIMGPLLYLKHLPCYHHIISVRSQVLGTLVIYDQEDSKTQTFGGIGYQEKDYGVSFPSGYGWCHVTNADAMLVVAVAMIPYIKTHRVGFFAILQKGDKIYRFSTYQLGKIKRFSHYQSKLYIEIEQLMTQVSIHVEYQQSCQLRAPKNGQMDAFVEESLDCKVHVQIEKNDIFLVDETFEQGTSEVFEYARMGFKQT